MAWVGNPFQKLATTAPSHVLTCFEINTPLALPAQVSSRVRI